MLKEAIITVEVYPHGNAIEILGYANISISYKMGTTAQEVSSAIADEVNKLYAGKCVSFKITHAFNI